MNLLRLEMKKMDSMPPKTTSIRKAGTGFFFRSFRKTNSSSVVISIVTVMARP